jgi:hypothetical protein
LYDAWQEACPDTLYDHLEEMVRLSEYKHLFLYVDAALDVRAAGGFYLTFPPSLEIIDEELG